MSKDNLGDCCFLAEYKGKYIYSAYTPLKVKIVVKKNTEINGEVLCQYTVKDGAILSELIKSVESFIDQYNEVENEIC